MRPFHTIGVSLRRLVFAAILLFVATWLPGCGKAEPTRKQTPPAAVDPVADAEPQSLKTAPESALTPPEIKESKAPPAPAVAMSPAKMSPDPSVDLESGETLEQDTSVEDEPIVVVEPETEAQPEVIAEAAGPQPVRLLLPTTMGPLLVAVEIRIGDQPLEAVFHERIDSVITEANEDPATVLTWKELFEHIAADPEQFGRQSIPNSSQYRDLIRRYDTNQNKRPDPDEVAKFLFRSSTFTGPFRLRGSDYFRNVNRSKSSVFAALDTDSDGVLQTSELDHAAEAILTLDQNANQRIDIEEAVRNTSEDNLAWNRRRSNRRGDVAMDLAGYVDWPMVSYALDGMMGTTPLGIKANPVVLLDEDNDDSISTDEAKNLLALQPNLTMRVEYPGGSGGQAKILLTSIQPELESLVSAGQPSRQLSIADDSFRLSAYVVDSRNNPFQIPYEAFAMLDANDDGVLDETEIPPAASDQFSFEELDQDQDGKLTYEEITVRKQETLPVWSVQVRGRGAESPDAVFAWLDQNHDQFLSAREIDGAGDRLRQCENDGQIKPANIPDTFSLQFVRGDPNRDGELFAMSRPSVSRASNIPRWAEHMDINRDGDISWQEFPGSREQFDNLDANHDAFIDIEEVRLYETHPPD